MLRSLWRIGGKQRALHLSWIAFFASFLMWFDFAPFASTIGHQLHLSKGELTTISLCNLGLTVPARVLVGALLDRFGPRRVYPAILLFAAIPNTLFALSTSFSALIASRLALSVVGAGFVVGIRMIAEWWPAGELGTAEGLYGGWGNLGGGVATLGLPLLADLVGGHDGWRWSIGLIGVLGAAWGVVYFHHAEDTPAAEGWRAPARQGALEVTSPTAVFGLAALMLPVVGVMALIAYRVELVHVITPTTLVAICGALAVLAAAVVAQVFRVNRPAMASAYAPELQYPLRSVAACCCAYAVTFGGELAMLSMLPTFFGATWKLGDASAGAIAGTFGVMNVVTRPSGGIRSDRTGRRRGTLVAALVGVAVGFAVMTRLHGGWPVGAAALVTIAACAFLQFGSGATFAVVPQIAPKVGGQIAGIVGAYGNIGGIVWLFLLLDVTPQALFGILAGGAALVALVVLRCLPDVAGDARSAERAVEASPVGAELAVTE